MAGPPNQEAGLLLVAVERYTWTTAVGYLCCRPGKKGRSFIQLACSGFTNPTFMGETAYQRGVCSVT